MTNRSPIERIKEQSRGLRGTLAGSLADAHTGGLREDDQQLIRLHGSYQQDDRDVREERRQRRLEPAWSFMVRLRLPGGVCTPAQWLAVDAIARQYGGGALRLTTRQTFQFHGIAKRHLKATMQALDAALLDTIAACGDVNRNVIASANAVESPVFTEVTAAAHVLAGHLLPQTRAWHEIWLDGEKLVGEPEPEPLYGKTFLPRKFKTAIAIPPLNDVDLFAQDLGFIAIVEHGRLAGYNLTVGGGMGATHGDPATYPRLADVAGFLPPERLLAVAEAVMTTQRDFGDRSNRKHARLKYTIADRGLDWFVGEVNRRVGAPLEPARPFRFGSHHDRFGWQRGADDAYHLTLRIPSGRIVDRDDRPWLTGLREIARVHSGHFRVTPNQNLILAGIAPEDRAATEELVARYALDTGTARAPLLRDALACVALPTCPLAMAEAERYLPAFSASVLSLLERHGLSAEPLSLRITGCPNGCARPYLAEIGLVGKAAGRYNLMLGGGTTGERLNVLYRENIDEAAILALLDGLFGQWAAERSPGERFGDFLWRTGRIGPEVVRHA